MLSSIFNRIEIAEELIINGADVNFKTDENWTALMLASFYGHCSIAEILLKIMRIPALKIIKDLTLCL